MYDRLVASEAVPVERTQSTTHQLLTLPNIITLVRLACIPIFLWLLFVQDDRASAAWLLGGLGATDWVDGWVARRYGQVSELGKILDPVRRPTPVHRQCRRHDHRRRDPVVVRMARRHS